MSITKSLVTIITESTLEKTLLRDIEAHGVRGYTISDARGRGVRGDREGSWDASANIRIEIICAEELAEALCEHLQATYFKDFAMVVYSHPVNVMRSNKF